MARVPREKTDTDIMKDVLKRLRDLEIGGNKAAVATVVPGAPTILSVTPGVGSVSVLLQPSSTGLQPDSYTVYTDTGFSNTDTGPTVGISGLTPGVPVIVTAVALTNGVPSVLSAPFAAVAPLSTPSVLSVVQSTKATGGTSNTATSTFPSAPTAGNLLLGGVSWNSVAGGAIHAADPWVQTDFAVGGTNDALATYLRPSVGAADTTTVPFTTDNVSANLAEVLLEIEGAAASGYLNDHAIVTTTALSQNSGQVTASVVGCLAVFVAKIDGTVTTAPTVTAGWTVLQTLIRDFHSIVIGVGDVLTGVPDNTPIAMNVTWPSVSSGSTNGAIELMLIGPTPANLQTPGAPTITSVSQVSATSAQVKWTLSPQGIAKTVMVTASNGVKSAAINAAAGQATVTGLPSNTPLTFTAVETNGGGSGPTSDPSSPITLTVSTPTSSSAFAIGVYPTSASGQDASVIPAYEAWLGHPITTVSMFGVRTTYGQLTAPAYAVDPVTARGKVVVISYAGVLGPSTASQEVTFASGGVGTNTTSTGETWNARHTAFGNFLVAHGQPNAFIRLVTEFNNGSGGQPQVNVFNSTQVAQYIAFFRTAYTALKAVAGNNFTILWDVAGDPGNNTNLFVAYPGDAYCDGLGLDNYNSVAAYATNWSNEQDEWNQRYNGASPGDYGYKSYLDFCAAHGKKWGVPELGLGFYYNNPGHVQTPADANVVFIQQMFALAQRGDCLFINFWEAYHLGIFSTNQSLPNSTAAYKATFGSVASGAWPQTGNAPNVATSVTAVGGAGQATVSWTGSAVDSSHSAPGSYVVTSNTGGFTATVPGTASSAVVNVPTTGSYTFTVVATNSFGSAASAGPSGSVTITTAPVIVGYNTIGTSSETTVGQGYRFGDEYTTSATHTYSAMGFYVGGGASDGHVSLNFWNVTTGALLGTTAQITVPAGQAPQWIEVPLVAVTASVASGTVVRTTLFKSPTDSQTSVVLYFNASGSASSDFIQDTGSTFPTPQSAWAAGGGFSGTDTNKQYSIYAKV